MALHDPAGTRDRPPTHRPARVVVTGLGVISNIGIGRDDFRDALRAGKCVVSPITAFDTAGYPYAHGTEVQDLGLLAGDYAALAETYGRSACLAVLASRQAMADAGIANTTAERVGVVLGTTDGESQVIDAIVRTWSAEGAEAVSPRDWGNAPAHRIAEAVSEELDLSGDCLTLATACAAGNYAIGHAADIVAAGEADIMLCGGVDSVCRKTYSGFFRLNAVTPDRCRPFDAGRSGILTGEGAAVLAIESLEHAIARGARIYAEILGYATNCDAHHMVAPHRDSIARCIRQAHARAGIAAADVDFISAHGTGTRTNDVIEVGAIRDVFGDAPPPTVSIKSMIGHTMGAASAMGAIAGILGMENDFIPPTVNFREADPECAIDCVPNVARAGRNDVFENHGFAFGGNNAILLMRNARELTA